MPFAKLAVFAGLIGCASDPPRLAANPLDTIDPSRGFVADARMSTGAALADGSHAQVGDHDRILFASDPLGVARLAAAVERERTSCKSPPCALDAMVEAAVTSYAQKSSQYTPILVAYDQALSGWAAVAAAHQALAIANVLDQTGVLTDTGRADIRQQADGLVAAAGSYGTLDWTTVTAATTEDPRIGEEILGHGPVITPLPEIEAAAIATVAAVLAEVDRETDPNGTGVVAPLPPLCCSTSVRAPVIGSPAYQALRRLALLREWTARSDGTTVIESYRAALATLANDILAAAPSDLAWSKFQTDASSYGIELATLLSTIEAAQLVDAPDIANILSQSGVQYEDANAANPRANVANVTMTTGWQDREPLLVLRTSLWIPHVPAGDIYQPLSLAIPALSLSGPPPASDGAIEVPPVAPIVIEWDVQTAAPLDHLDVQIFRDTAVEPFAHYIERPSAAGAFPTRTTFDPRTMDPDAPAELPITPLVVTYRVRAVAVDVLGRPSREEVSGLRVRFQAPPTDLDVRYSLFLPPGTPAEGTVTIGYDDAGLDAHGPTDQLTIRPYSTSTGSYVCFEPSWVVMTTTSGPLSIVNLDTQAHHLRAVYTAPHIVDPILPSLAIGGVQPLDLGTVPAGTMASIPLPTGAIDRTRWTLYDDVPVARPQPVKVVVRAR